MSASYREVPRKGRGNERDGEKPTHSEDERRKDDGRTSELQQGADDGQYHPHEFDLDGREGEDKAVPRNRSIDTRFQKGNRGGPGRPKGSRNIATIIRAVSNEKVTVVDGGRKRRMSRIEVSYRKLMQEAAKGNLRAIMEVIKLVERYGPEELQGLPVPETMKLDLAALQAMLENHQSIADDATETGGE